MSQTRLMDYLKKQQFTSRNYRYRYTNISAVNQSYIYDHYYTRADLYVLTHSSTASGIKQAIDEIKINHHEVLYRDNKQNNALHYILSGKLFELPANHFSDHAYYGPIKYYVPDETTDSPTLTQSTGLTDTHDLKQTALEYAHQQNQELSLIVEAVLTPFDSKPEAFTQLMLAKNQEGDTPLHIAIKKRTLKDIKPLLEKISTLSPLERKQIAFAGNKFNITTVGYVLQNCDEKSIEACISYFTKETLREAAFSPDKNGYTGFHYVCASTEGNATDKINQLIALEDKEKKGTLIRAMSTLTSDGQNVLHLACKMDKTDEANLIQTIKNVFIKNSSEEKLTSQWETLIARQDSQSNTSLHYACASGNAKSVEYLLKDLPISQKSKLINMPNSKGETPLDIACKFGNTTMISLIMESLSLEDSYHYRAKSLQTKHLKCIRYNKNTGDLEFKELLNKHTPPLIECYQYLVIRSKKSGFFHPTKDYEDRLEHFIACLTLKLQASEESLPLSSPSFFQGRSKQYQEKARDLDRVTQKEAEDFITFLQTEKNKTSVAARIVEALNKPSTSTLSIAPSAPYASSFV